jgi:hypothetical protein
VRNSITRGDTDLLRRGRGSEGNYFFFGGGGALRNTEVDVLAT